MRLTMLSLLACSSIAAAEVPETPVYIKKIQTNGTGCPLGTVEQNISDDKSTVSLQFSEMISESAPDLPPSYGRHNCVVTLVMATPPGWQFAIGRYRMSGFVGLDAGVKGIINAAHFFEGQGKTTTFSAPMIGPRETDYVLQDDDPIPSLWSECNKERALNMNFSVSSSNTNSKDYPDARGYVTLDSISNFELVWRRCS